MRHKDPDRLIAFILDVIRQAHKRIAAAKQKSAT